MQEYKAWVLNIWVDWLATPRELAVLNPIDPE